LNRSRNAHPLLLSSWIAALVASAAIAPPARATMPLRPDLREAAAKSGGALAPRFPALLAPARAGEIRTTGELRALILLIDFADQPAGSGHPPDFYSTLAFAETGKSLTTYYRENSYGQLHVTGAVSGWLRSNLSFKEDYVNRDQISGTTDDHGFDTSPLAYNPATDPFPKNVWGLVMEAASLVAPVVDIPSYDADGDGRIDALIIVHSGFGAEEIGGDNANYIWSHRSDLTQYLASIGQPPFLVAGIEIGGYVMVSESGKLGILCHEFGHLLGLPDLYRTDRQTGDQESAVGVFDIMDTGGWLPNNSPASNPAQFSAWCKAQLGWIEPIAVELAPGSPARIDGAVLVASANSTPPPVGSETAFFRVLANAGGRDWTLRKPGTGEYFLIENRQAGLPSRDYDFDLPASGLVIWHVDETRQNNDSNDPSEHLLTLVQADGEDFHSMTRDRLGEPSDLWPGTRQVARFTHETRPSSDLHGGVFSGAEVDSIRRAGQTIEVSLSAGGIRIGPAYAFPNPMIMDGGEGTISFVFRPKTESAAATSAAAPIRVRVYDLAGTLVATRSASDSPLAWDCRNASGQVVASGTYLFVLESQGETAEGKLAIVH